MLDSSHLFFVSNFQTCVKFCEVKECFAELLSNSFFQITQRNALSLFTFNTIEWVFWSNYKSDILYSKICYKYGVTWGEGSLSDTPNTLPFGVLNMMPEAIFWIPLDDIFSSFEIFSTATVKNIASDVAW
jgi:membrane protease subunit (stomatin/prohibitin family)